MHCLARRMFVALVTVGIISVIYLKDDIRQAFYSRFTQSHDPLPKAFIGAAAPISEARPDLLPFYGKQQIPPAKKSSTRPRHTIPPGVPGSPLPDDNIQGIPADSSPEAQARAMADNADKLAPDERACVKRRALLFEKPGCWWKCVRFPHPQIYRWFQYCRDGVDQVVVQSPCGPQPEPKKWRTDCWWACKPLQSGSGKVIFFRWFEDCRRIPSLGLAP